MSSLVPLDATPGGPDEPEPLLTIGDVAGLLAVPTPTVRTWNRRYGLGPSARSPGGHTRFRTRDVQRLSYFMELVDGGVAPHSASVVVLSASAEELAQHPGGPGVHDVGSPQLVVSASRAVRALVAAAQVLDAGQIGRWTAASVERWGVAAAWDDVLSPFLVEVGDQWFDGHLGVGAEHVVSEAVGNELRAVIEAAPQPLPRPSVLLAGVVTEAHVLPMLALEAALRRRGLCTVALGGAVPVEALRHAVERVRPAAVFLWASVGRHRVDEAVAALDVGDARPLVVVGGPGWVSGADRRDGGVRPRTLTEAAGLVAAHAGLPPSGPDARGT